MPRRRVKPGRLRRRLTIAFVLVAGVSAGALAAGSFALVRSARLNDSLGRSRTQALAGLRFADGFADRPFPTDELVSGLRDAGITAVLQTGLRGTPSDPRVDPLIPSPLRAVVARGDVAYQRVEEPRAPGRASEPLLIVGGPIGSTGRQLYFVSSEAALQRDLRRLGTVLLVGWGAVVLLAAGIGSWLARRTLEPVHRASRAARDISEGLLATRLPEAGDDEFGAWAASFNRMADALEGKIEALSEAQARERRFTADVAHELRTPVAALVGEASLLREHVEAMPEQARHVSELVVRDIARLRRLVDDLMEISRIDAGREAVVVQPVDAVALARSMLRSRGWEGAVTVNVTPVTIRTDPRRLERILSNLVANAVEHGGGSAEVEIRMEGEHVVLVVRDRGPGIPPEHLPHLFERFYKADPARAGRGSGLGLAIAMENARLLGGSIDVRSEPGSGATFTARLPVPVVSQPLPGGEQRVASASDDRIVRSSEGGTR